MDRNTTDRAAELGGVILWLIVGGGLLYGVVNTASQVVALFGS